MDQLMCTFLFPHPLLVSICVILHKVSEAVSICVCGSKPIVWSGPSSVLVAILSCFFLRLPTRYATKGVLTRMVTL